MIAAVAAWEVPIEHAWLIPLVNTALYAARQFLADNTQVDEY